MLLLLKTLPSGAAAANVGINLGLSGIAGTLASLGLSLGLTPPEAVETNITVPLDLRFGISAISSGFLSRTASADLTLGLAGLAAFSDSPSLGMVLGLSGTVGSFLQNSANFAITFTVSGQIVALPTATLDTLLGISGAPTLSGGTLTPTASVNITCGVTASNAVLSALGSNSLNINLVATGTQLGQAANLPTGPYISGVGIWDVTIRTYA